MEVRLARVRAVEQPAPARSAALADQIQCFIESGFTLHTGAAQIVERAQHVVMPVRRKTEARPLLPDYFAGRAAAEQAALEQVLVGTPARFRDLAPRPIDSLVLEQA